MKWIKYENDDCYAIVTCNYMPINNLHMELRIGDFVFIKEQYPGWYRGFKYSKPCILKVFPNTHVKLLSAEIHPDLWAEMYSWIPNIRETYLMTDNNEFDQVCEAVQLTLSEKRFDCLQEKSKVTEANRKALVSRMELTRKMLGLPIESRNDKSEKLDLQNISTLYLYNQHSKVQENIHNVSGQFDNTVENLSIFIKMVNINFEKSTNIDESIDVVVTLYKLEDRVKIFRISESYTYHVTIRVNQCDLIKTKPIVTKDIQFVPNQKIFLVFQLIRIGQMLTNKKAKKEGKSKFRRPLGVSVLDITGAIIETQDATRQLGIQLMQKEESMETVTERLIQDYRINRCDYRSTISIQLKIIGPDEFTDRHFVMYGMNPYFPPPIRSHRNCIYLTLYRADINRGGKKSDPNFEIDISIRDESGKLVSMPEDDWRKMANYRSVIYYHTGKPRWNEMICIPLFDKLEKFSPDTHVRFLIWHRSLNDRGKTPYGVAFLRLFPKLDSCAILNNKDHDLSIHKLEMDQIDNAKYLRYKDEIDCSIGKDVSLPMSVKTIGRKTKLVYYKDSLSVQTLLISNDYTFDDLLANVCCKGLIDQQIMKNLDHQEIIVKNIDVNELKKFAIKILESSLELLQRARDSTLLGRNILILLGEMFKAIKNLPDYNAQMEKFISETMHFNVHKQILHELINYAPEIDSNTLRASDWFMKIVVKSYQNLEAEFLGNVDEKIIFNDMVDKYLQKLEFWANGTQNRILRSIVLSKAGPIIIALIPVCQPIGMAMLVNNLLEASRDLDPITKAGLTMDCMNSTLFRDRDCRKIILPETTRNILELFSTHLDRIYHGREIDQEQMLDNICEKMVDFMILHERNWQSATSETIDTFVYELLIEHNMLRSCISIVSSGLEYLQQDDPVSRLLYKPMMVLVSVILTSLSFLSNKLWERIIVEQISVCPYCNCKQMTNNYDMVMELFALISQLQLKPVFPDCIRSDEENHRLLNYNKLLSPQLDIIHRQHRVMKQPWVDMLFVQSRQFLSTIGQIHKIVIKPYYLHNIIEIKLERPVRLCRCHPSDKLQSLLINGSVECLGQIIRQAFLDLDGLPPSSALRIMQNSKEWDYDIRLWGARLIREIWYDLNVLKINFSLFFFHEFSKLTTIINYQIRLLAVESMFDIVHLDHERMKTALITQIDQVMESADSSYSEDMSRALKHVLSKSTHQYLEDSQLVEHIMVQMNNIQECSHHLNDNSPINGMIVINNLRKFYQKMGRSDIIGRYLFKLMTLHSKIKNFTEMGYTLLELSSFYSWSHDLVTDTFFPTEYEDCEFEWQLKAQLLEDSLKYFEKEDWEQGIEVCTELVDGYTNFVVDFIKLSEVHKKMSILLKKVMQEDRQESLAYIIFYMGVGFPHFITDLPHRSIVLITKRNTNEVSVDLNSQFKNTTVEKRFPNESDELCADKKIFFMPIKANKFEIPSKYEGKNVKQRVLKYYENYNVDEFVFKRLMNATEEDPKKRKIEGCVIECDGKLPNILSVTPVRSLLRNNIDPFSEALNDIQNQIRKDHMLYQDYEMATLEKRGTMYQKMKDVIIKYISPVSGGVTKLVEMIPEQDETKLSCAGDAVSQAFNIIFQYMGIFEIYDNAVNYNIFLTEFRKIIKTVSARLDIIEEDFNINTLQEQFNRSRKAISIATTPRKPSIKPKHDDEGQMTIGRKRTCMIPKEMLEDIMNERRPSVTTEEDTLRPRIMGWHESFHPYRRESIMSNQVSYETSPPPKPKFLSNAMTLSRLNLELPSKPGGFGFQEY